MNRYMLTAASILVLTLLVHLYFATVFNESVQHPLDLLAMLFVVPVLLLSHALHLHLPFDGPGHARVIWLAGVLYATTCLIVQAIDHHARKPREQPTRSQSRRDR